MKVRTHQLLATTVLSAMCIWGVPLTVLANPQDGVVAAGQASIHANGSTLTIHQQSNKAVIDWRSFNIDAGEHTQFQQPSSSAIALNRVNSTSPTAIHGSLSANGNVVIVNQNGILFGQGAQVDVNGLVATTADQGLLVHRGATFIGRRSVP
jgi:filamentous hemagglutinin family protein